jgi:hypothetical protein
MTLSKFFKYYARKVTIVQRASKLNVLNKRLHIGPVLESYFKENGVDKLLEEIEVNEGKGTAKKIITKLYSDCDKAMPVTKDKYGNHWVEGSGFYKACDIIDKAVDDIKERRTLNAPSLYKHIKYKIIFDPPHNAIKNTLFLVSINQKVVIHFHYTNQFGFNAIWNSQKISAYRKDELREGSKSLIYLSRPPYFYPPEIVHGIVFLGRKEYSDRGDYFIAFIDVKEKIKSKQGTQDGEWTTTKSIDLADHKVIYAGKNPFKEFKL